MNFLLAALLLLFALDATALPRDQNEVRAFKRANPCPVTGQTKGRCPGYEIDHIKALRCGGADWPENMQWITVAAHKAKTKKEAKTCPKQSRQPRTGQSRSAKHAANDPAMK